MWAPFGELDSEDSAVRDTINRTMMEIQDKIAWYTRLSDVFLDVMAMRMSARKLDSSALRSAAALHAGYGRTGA